MTSQLVSAIKGTMMRVIKLDVCGNPVTGASGSVDTSPGFISIKPSPQYEDGTEYLQKLANNSLVVSSKDPSQLKRVDLDILVATMDPDLIVMLTGGRLIAPSATGTGFFIGGSTPILPHNSLEVWQQVSGRNACVGGVQQYVYWAFPNMYDAKVADWSIENGVLNFNLKATTDFASPTWGSTPPTNPPSSYLTGSAFQSGDMFAYNVMTVAPPPQTLGAAVPS